MGFARSIVIGSSAFMLGMIFVCQVIDVPLLYLDLTDSAIENAYKYYELWYESPDAIKALFHAALAVPMIAILFKLHGWSESAMFFDGSSLALHLSTIVIYLTVTIPSMRTFCPDSTKTSSFNFMAAPPPREAPPTADEKLEAVRVLAAGNTIIALLNVGIICMQLGQAYARRVEEREQRALDARIAAESAASVETKKDI